MAGAKWYLIAACVVAMWGVDVVSSSHHGGAAAPAAGPSSVDCSSLVVTLSHCLSYVSNDSTTTKPEAECCSNLKTVMKTAPNCLCEAFSSSAQLGVSINVTKAITLPAACKLSTPAAANCGLSLTPAASPGPVSPTSATPSSTTPGGNASSTLIPFSPQSSIAFLLLVALSLIPF